MSAPTRAGTSPSSIWAARRVPRAKDGGVPHVQVDLAASWWDPSSPMMCIATWVLTPVLPGAHVAEISLQCPWPLAGSDMSSRAWSHWLWCTARLVHRGQTCVMCRWRLARGAVPILKARNRTFKASSSPQFAPAQSQRTAVPRSTSVLISAVNVMLHVMLRGIPRVRLSRAVCGHGNRCMCARTGAGAPPLRWVGISRYYIGATSAASADQRLQRK